MGYRRTLFMMVGELVGVEALLDGEQYPDARNAHFDSAKAYMNSIGGGTDQIQRNIF